jgi:MoaA/NifB/PqqE/SkfB family radical SAM enzyme
MKLSQIIQYMKEKKGFRFHSKNDVVQIYSHYIDREVKGYQIILRTNFHCNMACEYCFVDHDIKNMDVKEIRKIIFALKQVDLSDSNFVISGGEPTLNKDLFWIIDETISNIGDIIIQSNATIFSDEKIVKKLPDSSKLSFFISFPSINEENYNNITNSKLFDKANKGIKNLSESYYLKLNVVVTKKNYQELENFPEYIAKKFNQNNISLIISNLGIIPHKDNDEFLVPYSKIMKHIEKMMNKAKEKNIDFKFTISGGCGFPLCSLFNIYDIKQEKALQKEDVNNLEYNSLKKQFYKNDKCKICSYCKFCQGYPSIYIKKFGDDEIKPIK